VRGPGKGGYEGGEKGFLAQNFKGCGAARKGQERGLEEGRLSEGPVAA